MAINKHYSLLSSKNYPFGGIYQGIATCIFGQHTAPESFLAHFLA